MNSINTVIDQARELGRYAATSDKALSHLNSGGPSDAHHPGDDVGRLTLGAYRSHGVDGAKSVVEGYLDAYNSKAAEIGSATVSVAQVKRGIGWALPGATPDEAAAIPAAL